MKINKVLWFRISLVLVPVVLIFLAELILRLFNLFPQEPLFLENYKGGDKVFQLNTEVAKRYFDTKQVAIPNLYPETFQKNKSDKTFRIFCLGGSTTAGFPFDYQVPFPFQLKILLSNYYSDYKFEIINLGISAINSFSVLDLIPDILKKQPDLIIIYMGHNEFYGAYGSASAFSVGQNGSFIRFYLKLQKLRLVQMLRSIISFITPEPQTADENATLMEKVIGEKEISYQSEKYWTTLNNFETNLNLILNKCSQRNVPVILGSLVSNLKDQPPFGNSSLVKNDADTILKIEKLEQKSDSLLENNTLPEALKLSKTLFNTDSSSAKNWFKLGKIYLQLGDTTLASKYFIGAKDRDIIRFRASVEVNQIIKQATLNSKSGFVDIRQKFSNFSTTRIAGKELLCDHLHPNPIGYNLMAKWFAEEIIGSNYLKNLNVKFKPQKDPYYITDLDWDIGLLKIYKLLHRWPFDNKEVNYDNYKAYHEPEAAKLAYDYLFSHNNWVQAHFKMADYFTEKEQNEDARKEYLAVSAYYPKQPDVYIKIGQTYEKDQNWNSAEKYFTSALTLSNKKGLIYYQLAIAQWRQKKMAQAIQNIQMAIVSPELNTEQKIAAKYYLAGFLVDVKRMNNALTVIQDILTENPNFEPAQELLRKYFKK